MYSREDFLPLPTIVAVHPSSVSIYKDVSQIKKKKLHSLNSFNNLKNHENRNKVSEQAKRKLNRSIDYLLYTAKQKTVTNNRTQSKFVFKAAFITLTLSSHQEHSDQLLKSELLNQFLTEAKKRWKMTKYVWKAERQCNGNLHFHILTDVFIPYNELRNSWNRIQSKLGYIAAFQKVHGHKTPNSTDVHSLAKVKNVRQYMSKYMTKETLQNRCKETREHAGFRPKKLYSEQTVSTGAKDYLRKMSNNGRIWGCSTNLSDLKGGRSDYDSYISKEVDLLCSHKKTKIFSKDYFSCLFFEPSVLNPVQFPELYSLLQSFISQHIEPQQQQIVFNEYLPPNTDFIRQ